MNLSINIPAIDEGYMLFQCPISRRNFKVTSMQALTFNNPYVIFVIYSLNGGFAYVDFFSIKRAMQFIALFFSICLLQMIGISLFIRDCHICI
jgi:hypothetical protein